MTLKTRKITQSPLPFMGQKRRFLKKVIQVIENCPENSVFVDLFGGSGLLSYAIKNHFPNSTVIYNDYDNYSKRLENIPKTNLLIADIRTILIDSPKDKKIIEPARSKIIERVAKEELTGYVDYITLSSNIMFSMKYVLSLEALKKETFYNCVRLNDYNADGYLDGLIVESADYREIFVKYKNNDNVVFLVDPPYLSTDVGTYKSYWKLKDYLDVLNVLDGTNYLYFTSNKSQIVELCEWMKDKPALYNPFEGSTTSTVNNQVSFNSSYTDIMLHKVNYVFK